MWQVLTGEVQLVQQVFAHLLEVLSLSLPYQEKTKANRVKRLETGIPKAVSWLFSLFLFNATRLNSTIFLGSEEAWNRYIICMLITSKSWQTDSFLHAAIDMPSYVSYALFPPPPIRLPMPLVCYVRWKRCKR